MGFSYHYLLHTSMAVLASVAKQGVYLSEAEIRQIVKGEADSLLSRDSDSGLNPSILRS